MLSRLAQEQTIPPKAILKELIQLLSEFDLAEEVLILLIDAYNMGYITGKRDTRKHNKAN